MKKIIIIVVVLVLAVAVYGYFYTSKKHPDVLNKTPDTSITTAALLESFTKDTTVARKNFIENIVRVTGRVKRLDSRAVVSGE
jgi:hypothetical protein